MSGDYTRGARADATSLGDEPLPLTAWRGPYPGTVVSTEDPIKRGRVRVRVPQAYGDSVVESEFIGDDALPWARPAFPCHDLHAGYEPGDGVWVVFWGQTSSEPVLLGQWLGEAEGASDVPEAFTSAYTPDPRTRLIRTRNGHLIEMRWVDGQERITVKTAVGVEIELLDADALGGPKLTAKTPGEYRVVLDEKEQKVTLQTPTQKVELAEVPPVVTVETPGDVVVNAQGQTQQTYAGPAANTLSFTGATTATFLAALALAVAGTLSITVATIAFLGALAITLPATLAITATGIISLTGSAVAIGSAGAKLRLCNELLITAVVNVNKLNFDAHTHLATALGAPTGAPITPGLVPVVFTPAVLGTHTTTATTAN